MFALLPSFESEATFASWAIKTHWFCTTLPTYFALLLTLVSWCYCHHRLSFDVWIVDSGQKIVDSIRLLNLSRTTRLWGEFPRHAGLMHWDCRHFYVLLNEEFFKKNFARLDLLRLVVWNCVFVDFLSRFLKMNFT